MEHGEILRTTVVHSQSGASAPHLVFTWEYNGVPLNDSFVSDEWRDRWLLGDWGSVWQELASTEASIISYRNQVIDAAGRIIRTVGTGSVFLGGLANSPVLPSANSAQMLASVSEPGRRGMKYVPGITEESVESGTLTDIAMGLLLDLAIVYLSEFVITVGTDLVPGIASAALDRFLPFNNSGQITNVPAYQRRRKPGVGV